MGRRLLTLLDRMRPSVASRVARAQARQKIGHDQSSHDRQFHLGDSVFVRNFAVGPTWIAGCITAENGPRSFTVELNDGRVVKRHLDHVRSRSVGLPPVDSNGDSIADIPLPSIPASPEPTDHEVSCSSQPTTPRRFTRQRGPPDRYTP